MPRTGRRVGRAPVGVRVIVSVDGPARASTSASTTAASRDFPPDSDDQPLRVAMKKVATALKGANVPFALSGGYASWARGGPEPVHDVDFVLLADDVPHALQVLDAAGLRVVEPPEDWLVKVYDGDALVDLIFRRPSGRSPASSSTRRTRYVSTRC